jgi:hypothetical protein
MTLEEVVRSAGITDAHIVDDAFDLAPGSGLQPRAVQSFLDAIDDAQFSTVANDLGDPNGNDEWIIAQLATVSGAGLLFAQREKYGAAAARLFEEFLESTEPEKIRIQPLLDCLGSLGIACHKFGRDYNGDTLVAPQLLFVDLKLNEMEIRIEDPIRVVQKLMNRHPSASPLVFLISTLADSLSERRTEFRDRCQLFTTQFETLSKQLFANQEQLRWFLDDHMRVYPIIRELQMHAAGWGLALDRAKRQLQKTLRSLDLADYFVLYQNTVAAEKVPLGTYMTDLLLKYVTHEVEADPEISSFARALDDWKLRELTRSRFNVRQIVGDIFSANVLHSDGRLRSEAERGRGTQHGYIQLGDVFFSRSEIAKNELKTALVVLSPACDLVRPEVIAQRRASIMLCEGEVEKLKSMAPHSGADGIDPVILRHPAEGGVQFVIQWQKKRPRTWNLSDLGALRDPPTSPWIHVGRLRPLYAIQLQHAVTADLSRVGLQRPPAEYRPCGIEVFVADNGRWKILKLGVEGDPSAGAICEDRAAGQVTIIVSDGVLRSARAALLQWADQSQETHAGPLRQLFLNDEIVRQLMFCTIRLRKDDKKRSVFHPLAGLTALPLNGQEQLIAFAKQEQQSKSDYVGGKSILDEEPSRVVFRFLRVRD